MEDKLLVRREGAGVFNGSYKLFSAVFRLTILNWRLNAGLKLPSTLSPIPVFVPPLLSHTCAF